MSDTCLYEGWHHERRFRFLRDTYGREGLGTYFLLQAYFQKYSHDTWMVDLDKEMKFICIDLGLTEDEVKVAVESVVSSGLGAFVGDTSVLFLEKAKKHVLPSVTSLPHAHDHRTVTDRARSDDRSMSLSLDVSAPSEKQFSAENFSRQAETSDQDKDKDDTAEGLKITLGQLTQDLTVSTAKNSETWMRAEARDAGIKRNLEKEFDAKTKKDVEKKIEKVGERNFCGAWRVCVWDRSCNLGNPDIRTPVKMFLSDRVFNEKVERFLELTGEASHRRYVSERPERKVAKREHRPEPEPVEVPLSGKGVVEVIRETVTQAAKVIRMLEEHDLVEGFRRNAEAMGIEVDLEEGKS